MRHADWLIQSGSTEKFAVRTGLAAANVRQAEYASDEPDFGFFEIWMRGRCLTRNVHALAQEPRDWSAWNLIEFVDWIVSARHSILHEFDYPLLLPEIVDGAHWLTESLEPRSDLTTTEETEWRMSRHRWWSKHAIRSMDGVALPNLVFRRSGNSVEVSWDNRPADGARPDIAWTESRGRGLVDARTVASVLAEIAERTLERFADAGVVSERLASDAANLRSRPVVTGRRVFDSEGRQDASSGVWLLGPVGLAASGEASRLDDDDLKVIQQVVENSRTRTTSCKLDRRRVATPAAEPWLSGYELADDLREALGWGDDPAPNLEQFLEENGVDYGEIRLTAELVHGLSVWGAGIGPTIRVNASSPRARVPAALRMLIAHELCHLLHDGETDDFVSILSSDHVEWPREARANAFAAWFLMPREGLRARIAGRAIDDTVIEDLTFHFGVSKLALTWHLKNLGFIEESERGSLYAGSPDF